MRLDKGGATIAYLESGEPWIVLEGAVSVWVSWDGTQIPVGVFVAGETVPGVAKFMIEIMPDQPTSRLQRAPGKNDPDVVQRLFDAAVMSRKPATERVRYWLNQWVRGDTLTRINQGYLGRLAGVSRELASRTIAQLSAVGVLRTTERRKRRYVAFFNVVKH